MVLGSLGFVVLAASSNRNLHGIKVERSVSLGSMRPGEIIRRNVPFSNIGNEDVELMSLTSSCSCIGAFCSKRIVKPSERKRTEPSVEIFARGRPSDRGAG